VDGCYSGGGSRPLAELIDDYGDVLAADLKEVYDVDLRDLLVPGSGVTPKWLFVLIKGLPETSRFMAEKRGGQQFRGWDASRYALVATVNALRALQYTYITAHSKSKPKLPEMFPIPDDIKRKNDGPGSFAFIAAQRLAETRRRLAG